MLSVAIPTNLSSATGEQTSRCGDKDGRIFITTQNHGFAVDAGSLPEGCRVTYTNVNDGTVEGFENDDLCLTTVQFHPEAHGGPRDTEQHFFDALFRRLK